MLKLDVLSAELNLWANETEQYYYATKDIKYRKDTTHLRYLAATLNQSTVSIPTLDQVTTAGNTTNNSISVGRLTVATNLIYTDTINNRIGIGMITPAYKLHVAGTLSAQLSNSTQSNIVYYNTSTGELTYGTAPVITTPTLAQVTTAGNTTTNSIVLGSSSAITVSPYTLQVVGGAGGSAIFSNSTKTQGLNINLTTSGETRIYGDYFGAGVDQKLILGTFANRANQ